MAPTWDVIQLRETMLRRRGWNVDQPNLAPVESGTWLIVDYELFLIRTSLEPRLPDLDLSTALLLWFPGQFRPRGKDRDEFAGGVSPSLPSSSQAPRDSAPKYRAPGARSMLRVVPQSMSHAIANRLPSEPVRISSLPTSI